MTRRFGSVTAVDDVSFEIERGSVAGFLGPNGAGKTTAMRMLAGVLEPTSGAAFIHGFDVLQQAREAHQVLGWLPDGAPACEELRVDEYLRFRGGLYGGIPRQRYEQVCGQCGLLDVRRRLVGQLSRGYRQRVALAAAIVPDPVAIILDEPGTGLDPIQQLAFRSLVQELAQERAILLSTHQVGEAMAMCDELLVIVGGKLLAQGPINSLRQSDTSQAAFVEVKDIDVLRVLGGVDGVQSVRVKELANGWFQATCDCTSDIRAAVHDAITAAGGHLRELRYAGTSTEEWLRGLLEETQA
jgi:ABC-2 type transport system ATP-binding protein